LGGKKKGLYMPRKFARSLAWRESGLGISQMRNRKSVAMSQMTCDEKSVSKKRKMSSVE
jgi:hypothetical protein